MDAGRILRNTLLAAALLLAGLTGAWSLRSYFQERDRLCPSCDNERIVLLDNGGVLTAIPCEECERRFSIRALGDQFIHHSSDVRNVVLRWGRRHPEEAVFVAGSMLYLGLLLGLAMTRRCRACAGSGYRDVDAAAVCDRCGGLGQRTVLERLFAK